MSKDTGGQAFPDFMRLQLLRQEGLSPEMKETVYMQSSGMTLRDYFAAKALQALLTSKLADEFTATMADMARDSYRMADAMLKERAK
jgi:hypothetical protein